MELLQYYLANQDDTYQGIAAKCNVNLKAFLAYNCLNGDEGIFGFERFLIPRDNFKRHKHLVRHLFRLFQKKCCKKPLIKIVEYCECDTMIVLIAIIGVKKHKLIPRNLLTSLSLPGFSNCELYPLAALEELFASDLNCSCLGQPFSLLPVATGCQCAGCNSLLRGANCNNLLPVNCNNNLLPNCGCNNCNNLLPVNCNNNCNGLVNCNNLLPVDCNNNCNNLLPVNCNNNCNGLVNCNNNCNGLVNCNNNCNGLVNCNNLVPNCGCNNLLSNCGCNGLNNSCQTWNQVNCCNNPCFNGLLGKILQAQ